MSKGHRKRGKLLNRNQEGRRSFDRHGGLLGCKIKNRSKHYKITTHLEPALASVLQALEKLSGLYSISRTWIGHVSSWDLSSAQPVSGLQGMSSSSSSVGSPLPDRSRRVLQVLVDECPQRVFRSAELSAGFPVGCGSLESLQLHTAPCALKWLLWLDLSYILRMSVWTRMVRNIHNEKLAYLHRQVDSYNAQNKT